MSCFHPQPAYWCIGAAGRRMAIRVDKASNVLSNDLVGLPCGYCIGCRTSRAREWAVRARLESFEHDVTSVWTLTYDDSKGPCPPEVRKRHYSGFIKRLRARKGSESLRHFGSGEYGDEGDRPHYHALLFNVRPGDPDVVASWSVGTAYYDAVSDEAIAYVCGYVTKKLLEGGEGEPASVPPVVVSDDEFNTPEFLSSRHPASARDGRVGEGEGAWPLRTPGRWLVNASTGEARLRAREFRLMSRNPGIAGAARARHPDAFREKVSNGDGLSPAPPYLKKLWLDRASAPDLRAFGLCRYRAFLEARDAGLLTPEQRSKGEEIAISRRRLFKGRL